MCVLSDTQAVLSIGFTNKVFPSRQSRAIQFFINNLLKNTSSQLYTYTHQKEKRKTKKKGKKEMTMNRQFINLLL